MIFPDREISRLEVKENTGWHGWSVDASKPFGAVSNACSINTKGIHNYE